MLQYIQPGTVFKQKTIWRTMKKKIRRRNVYVISLLKFMKQQKQLSFYYIYVNLIWKKCLTPAISQDHNIDERICNQLAVSLILKKLRSFSCAHTLNVGHALLWGFSSSLSSLCLNLEFKGTTDLVCEKVMLQ